MAGRNRYPHEAYNNHLGYPPERPAFQVPMPRSMPHHPILLEEKLELQHHEIHRLLDENQMLVKDRTVLQRELGAAKEELRQMNIAIDEIQTEIKLHLRQLIENGQKLESDIRATKPLKKEAGQLHAEVERLRSIRYDLSKQVQILTKDLAKLQADNKQLPALRAEYEDLHEKLMHVRAAIDYEKKGGIELINQKQAMERNLVSMAREVEMLRAELAGGSYRMHFSSTDDSFTRPNGDAYGRPLGAADSVPLYDSSSTPWTELEKSRMTHLFFSS